MLCYQQLSEVSSEVRASQGRFQNCFAKAARGKLLRYLWFRALRHQWVRHQWVTIPDQTIWPVFA